MRPIRIAIIGFGKIAADQHVPAIQGNHRFELVASSSRSGKGVGQAFTDWRELIRSVEGLEAVAITTPPEPRYDIARECLLAGLHCLLEKPPTTGTAEIADLDCLAQAQQATLFTTWHAQHHATVDAAAQALAGKRIRSMTIHWHEDVKKWHPGQQWIWEPGGFGVFDPGINALSVLTRILTSEVCVSAAQLEFPQNQQAPIAAQLRLRTTKGVEIDAEFDFRQEGEQCWDIELTTTTGTLKLSNGGASLEVDGRALSVEAGLAGEYPRLYQRFAELCARGESDVDVRPFQLVADAFLVGERLIVGPHHI